MSNFAERAGSGPMRLIREAHRLKPLAQGFCAQLSRLKRCDCPKLSATSWPDRSGTDSTARTERVFASNARIALVPLAYRGTFLCSLFRTKLVLELCNHDGRDPVADNVG
jgi:hypothetical protein